MQPIALGAQQVDSANADLQMLRDRAFIEAVGLPGQFDFAVQRFVGHAQQGAVRHPETIPLSGDGGAFHVYRHGAAEVKAQRRGRVAQLPVTVVGGDYRAGTQALFDLFAGHAADHFGGVV
ncbi:hypothetical protein D3C73_1452040 [compost metagenome]